MPTPRILPMDDAANQEKRPFTTQSSEEKTNLSIQLPDRPEMINYDLDSESESRSGSDEENEKKESTLISSKPDAIAIKNFKQLIKLIEKNMAESKGEYHFQPDESLQEYFDGDFDTDKINHINAAIAILTSTGIKKSSYIATLIISDDPSISALAFILLEGYKLTALGSMFYDVIDPEETDIDDSDNDDYYIFLLSIVLMHSEAIDILHKVQSQNEESWIEYSIIEISCSQLYQVTHANLASRAARPSEIDLATAVASSTSTTAPSNTHSAPPSPAPTPTAASQEVSSTQTSSAFFLPGSTPTAQAASKEARRFTFN